MKPNNNNLKFQKSKIDQASTNHKSKNNPQKTKIIPEMKLKITNRLKIELLNINEAELHPSELHANVHPLISKPSSFMRLISPQ